MINNNLIKEKEMKKYLILIFSLMMILVSSCGNRSTKNNTTEPVDSVLSVEDSVDVVTDSTVVVE